MAALGGALVGLLTLLLGGQQFFSSQKPDTSPQRMEQLVDDYLDRERKEPAFERHREAEQRARVLVEMMSAPGFGQLPQEKKEAIRNRHRELREYVAYTQALAAVPDPVSARTEADLAAIRQALDKVRVPPEYLTEWAGTDARDRHQRWLLDVEALEKVVPYLAREYVALVEQARAVRKTASAANLPGRARAVLDRAKELPDAKSTKPLGNSPRLTYAAAFAFPSVAVPAAQWEQLRKQMLGLAEIDRP